MRGGHVSAPGSVTLEQRSTQTVRRQKTTRCRPQVDSPPLQTQTTNTHTSGQFKVDVGHRETVSYHSSTQNLHLSLYNNSNNSPILLTSASLHFPLTARFVSFLSLM